MLSRSWLIIEYYNQKSFIKLPGIFQTFPWERTHRCLSTKDLFSLQIWSFVAFVLLAGASLCLACNTTCHSESVRVFLSPPAENFETHVRFCLSLQWNPDEIRIRSHNASILFFFTAVTFCLFLDKTFECVCVCVCVCVCFCSGRYDI